MKTTKVLEKVGSTETVKVDRTPEKLKLMRSLGLRIALDSMLGFKPIPVAEIAKKIGLRKVYFELDGMSASMGLMYGLLAGLLAGGLVELALHWAGIKHPAASGFIGPLVVLSAAGLIAGNWIHEVNLDNKAIKEWPHLLPYGALLAMSEAKSKGIEDFTIWYPTRARRIPTYVSSAPVITGETKSGLMVEIFSWDDSKIYD